MLLDLHVTDCLMLCVLEFLRLAMDVEKCPSLQMAHLGSDLQGQYPGVVGVLGCFLCLDDL